MPNGATPSKLSDMFFEDFREGETIAFGHWTATKEEIVEYGRTFDPQPFHTSEETAKDSNIGRLIASGYHTCSILMRLAADHVLGGENAFGSPGVDDVRFLKPVEPGDELSGRITCLSKRELRSKPGVGVMHCNMSLVNGHGEEVIAWDFNVFRRMRSWQVSKREAD